MTSRALIVEDSQLLCALLSDALKQHEVAEEVEAHNDAEALFISCTAIRAVDVVGRIERALGKPVITSIQAMFWQALGYAGHFKPIAGYARLLRLAEEA